LEVVISFFIFAKTFLARAHEWLRICGIVITLVFLKNDQIIDRL
jgi:hypothetical protein